LDTQANFTSLGSATVLPDREELVRDLAVQELLDGDARPANGLVAATTSFVHHLDAHLICVFYIRKL
jgi:hypothetical protein